MSLRNREKQLTITQQNMKNLFASIFGLVLMISPMVYAQDKDDFHRPIPPHQLRFAERQSPQAQLTTRTMSARDYANWSAWLDMGLNQFRGDMTPLFRPTLTDPLNHFNVGFGAEYTFNPMFAFGLGFSFMRYGMFDERGTFNGDMYSVFPLIGINLLNFPMLNRHNRWDLWFYFGAGATHFNANLEHFIPQAVWDRFPSYTQAERDAIIFENQTRWTGVIPMAIELSYCISRQFAIALRARYYVFTSDDLEGQPVKRQEHGLDRYGRKNYNLSGVNNDHIAALSLGLRWNITPRNRTHMRQVRWEDFVASDLHLGADLTARLDSLEGRVNVLENKTDALGDELHNFIHNLPIVVADGSDGEDAELLIPPVFIFFDLDRHDLRPDALAQVLTVAAILDIHPNIVIDVVGWTDIRGSVAHNDALSQRRAKRVRDELVNVWGIDPSRITSEGRGKAIEPNPTDPNYFQINRRVEVRFFMGRGN